MAWSVGDELDGWWSNGGQTVVVRRWWAKVIDTLVLCNATHRHGQMQECRSAVD